MIEIIKQINSKLYSKMQMSILRHRFNNSFWENTARIIERVHTDQNVIIENDDFFHLANGYRENCLNFYFNKYIKSTIRILIQAERPGVGIGSFSIFNNWVKALNYMGIDAEIVYNDESILDKINLFNPTLFFTSDSSTYLKKIDWDALNEYRKSNKLLLAFTASSFHDGNTANEPRLEFAIKNKVDFFISFRTNEYIDDFLSTWKKAGFDVLSIPFSANPLYHYYIPSEEKYIDYIFLASNNPDKSNQHISYLKGDIIKKNTLINGPGWTNSFNTWIPQSKHSLFYSKSKIGLNLHIDISLNYNSEINERTFILSACGVFQICDKPLAMNNFFDENAIITADNEKEYHDFCRYFISRPHERLKYSKNAIKQLYDNNTTFNRMDVLVNYLLGKL